MLLNSITNLWPALYISPPKSIHIYYYNNYSPNPNFFQSFHLTNSKCNRNVRGPNNIALCCRARRRIRYEDDEEEDDGYNEEIGMLEMYSQSARGEALLVTAMVDDEEVEVVIFKGFSSCLSYGTSSDPSKSILPQRAVIKSIDRIKGPFNPTNIDYIEKGLTMETFISRFSPN